MALSPKNIPSAKAGKGKTALPGAGKAGGFLQSLRERLSRRGKNADKAQKAVPDDDEDLDEEEAIADADAGDDDEDFSPEEAEAAAGFFQRLKSRLSRTKSAAKAAPAPKAEKAGGLFGFLKNPFRRKAVAEEEFDDDDDLDDTFEDRDENPYENFPDDPYEGLSEDIYDSMPGDSEVPPPPPPPAPPPPRAPAQQRGEAGAPPPIDLLPPIAPQPQAQEYAGGFDAQDDEPLDMDEVSVEVVPKQNRGVDTMTSENRYEEPGDQYDDETPGDEDDWNDEDGDEGGGRLASLARVVKSRKFVYAALLLVLGGGAYYYFLAPQPPPPRPARPPRPPQPQVVAQTPPPEQPAQPAPAAPTPQGSQGPATPVPMPTPQPQTAETPAGEDTGAPADAGDASLTAAPTGDDIDASLEEPLAPVLVPPTDIVEIRNRDELMAFLNDFVVKNRDFTLLEDGDRVGLLYRGSTTKSLAAFSVFPFQEGLRLDNFTIGNGGRVSSEILNILGRIPGLRELSLLGNGDNIDDKSLTQLAVTGSLRELTTPSFNGRITVAGLIELKKRIPGLRVRHPRRTGPHAVPRAEWPEYADVLDWFVANEPMRRWELVGDGTLSIEGYGLNPRTLQRVEDCFFIEGLYLYDCTSHDYTVLERLPDLRWLKISNNRQFGTIEVRDLAKLPKLEELSLEACQAVSDAALASMETLPGLKKLSFQDNDKITRNGLESIAKLPNLKSLNLLLARRLSSADMLALAPLAPTLEEFKSSVPPHPDFVERFRNLRSLACHEAEIDVALANIDKFRNLEKLDLYLAILLENYVRDQANLERAALHPNFGKLAQLPMLKELSLANTDFNDTGWRVLSEIPSLERLDLAFCRLTTGAGIGALASLRNLRRIDLSQCEKLTDAALAELVRLPALEVLDIDGCYEITDEGVTALAASPSLKILKLSSRQVTSKGIAALSRARSLHTLYLDVNDHDHNPADMARALASIPALKRMMGTESWLKELIEKRPTFEPRLETIEFHKKSDGKDFYDPIVELKF